MHHHRQARAAARALAPVVVRRHSCGKRWYADRIAADLALALIRRRGRALGKDPVRSYRCPNVRRLAPDRDRRVALRPARAAAADLLPRR